MTFQEWFNSAPHRAKYSNDNPAYLAAQEAWEAAHEACAKVCESMIVETLDDNEWVDATNDSKQRCATAIRERSANAGAIGETK